jgi:hypothetical protein
MPRLASLLLGMVVCASAQETNGLPETAAVAPVKRPLHLTLRRDEPYQPLTASERGRLFLKHVMMDWWDPPRAALAAGINQWQDDPEGWPQGMRGYGRRFADNYARFTIRDSLEMIGASALGHEVRYIPSQSRGKMKRVLHALAGNFRTYNTEGEWRPHYSRIGSAFAANYVAHTWRPPEQMTAGNVLGGAAFQLMFGAMRNISREFRPEINRLFRRGGSSKTDAAPQTPGGLAKNP